MGVAGDFLPRVLEATGKAIDLKEYRDGICLAESAGKYRGNGKYSNGKHSNGTRKRPLRIGIDVSAWIYRAGFAFGDKLMHEERHLTAYGRANLQQEREQQHQQQQHQQQQEQQHNDDEDAVHAEKVRDYCDACANYVLKRLELLKRQSRADLLVVFDGRTPPIKTATVSQRKQSREAYQSLRAEESNRHSNGRSGGAAAAAAVVPVAGEERDENHTNAAAAAAMHVQADIEERVKANRRAGPGEHVPRIVDAIIEKLRDRGTPNTKAQQQQQQQEQLPGTEHANAGEEAPRNNHRQEDHESSKDDYLAAWMVAPYEADSQLAYLSKQSYIDLVITEDTDLIAHGCRSVLYKCLENTPIDNDRNNNNLNPNHHSNASETHIDISRGKLVEFQDLGGSKVFSESSSKAPDLTDFSPVMMAVLFVLLGCDYNGHCKLKGIGILKASNIVRKAFLEPHPTSSSSSSSHHQQHNEDLHSTSSNTIEIEEGRTTTIIPISPIKKSKSPSNNNNNGLSCLDMVWKEAYEQSYESSSVFTEEFKRDYQKSFCEALWMYRHPIVFDPMIRTCIQTPSPVSYDDKGGPPHERTMPQDFDDSLGDPELLEGCIEYSELACDSIRIRQVVGELPPTQEECISIAEGRTHNQWKLRKPTPIYNHNSNSNSNSNFNHHHSNETRNGSNVVEGRANHKNGRRKRKRFPNHPHKRASLAAGEPSAPPAFASKRTRPRREPQHSGSSDTETAISTSLESQRRNRPHADSWDDDDDDDDADAEDYPQEPSNSSVLVSSTEETNNEESNASVLVNSTQSDRRRSLDSDEIAAVAAGGFKKGDRRPDANRDGGMGFSRNLFPGQGGGSEENAEETEEEFPEARQNLPPPMPGQQPNPSLDKYDFRTPESEKTILLAEHTSPNLLASMTTTTPTNGTQSSSSKKSLSATTSGVGTQSSSKATTKTLSQSQMTSQSQSQSSSSKATPKTPSSAKSVDLLASSATKSPHSSEALLETAAQSPSEPTQVNSFETPMQSKTRSLSESPAPSESQSSQLSTHVEMFGTQSFQTPPPMNGNANGNEAKGDDNSQVQEDEHEHEHETETQAVFTQEETPTFEIPKRRLRSATKTPRSSTRSRLPRAAKQKPKR